MKNTKKCPKCGKSNDFEKFKCKKCGSWLDNEVFEKLDKFDIEIIKSRDLTIATPSWICFMLLEPMTKEFMKIMAVSEEVTTRVFFFHSYCFANALNISARKEKGKEFLLKKGISEAFVKQAIFIMKQCSSSIIPEAQFVNIGLNIFEQLDKLDKKYPYRWEDPTPGEFLIA